MSLPALPVRSSPLLLAAFLGLLAGCDGNDAPDDAVQHPRASEVVRIVPPEEALANAEVARLDPATMNDAQIREVIGSGPRCAFRYTTTGKPVLAVAEQTTGQALRGVVKLNGSLIRLDAAPDEGATTAAGRLLLGAGLLRVTVMPDGSEGAADRNGTRRREADLVFEVGESLRVGYRGYLSCSAASPTG